MLEGLNGVRQGFLNDLERVDREIMTEAEYPLWASPGSQSPVLTQEVFVHLVVPVSWVHYPSKASLSDQGCPTRRDLK